MLTISQVMETALNHHRAGQLKEAEEIYRQVLRADSNNIDALYLLGTVKCQQQDYKAGIEYLRTVLTIKPELAEAHNNIAAALAQLGRVDEAISHYKQALNIKPDYAEAYFNLGNALNEEGRLDAAIAQLEKALAIKPDYLEALYNLANLQHKQGDGITAISSYKRVLELRPDYPEALNSLGRVLKEQGKLDEAKGCYERVLAIKPDCPDAQNNLGVVLAQQGNQGAAISSYERVLAVEPDNVAALNNLGVALQNQGNLLEAISQYEKVLRLKPDYPEAYVNLGYTLQELGNLDEATRCYEQAIRLKPDYAEAHSNLGVVLVQEGELDKAVASYEQALKSKPDFAEAYNNLGVVLEQKGKLEQALRSYKQALSYKTDYADAQKNLASALWDKGELAESISFYEKALASQLNNDSALMELTHQLQHICRWKDLDKMAQRLQEIVESPAGGNLISPFFFLSLPTTTTPQQQLLCASQWAKKKLRRGDTLRSVPTLRCAQPGTPQMLTMRRPGPRTRLPDSNSDGKINLGYLSADFREHPMPHLLAEMFEKHDRDQFSIVAYSIGPDDGSQMRERLGQAFDRFVDLSSLSHSDAAQRIRDDRVDILIDLMGYTKLSRTEIVALRPAPIQVSYMGYPATMTADFIDYIFVDDFVVPKEQQPYFSEKLVHLPECYWVTDGRRKIADSTPSRVECGLPEDGFVFCCFNNNYKITRDVFGIWMRLLNEVPGSVLWLMEGNMFAADNLKQEAETCGVSQERLVFAPRMPSAEHLARHRHIDLVLDTRPYNAHTTASDALLMGRLVLTITGNTFVSRVGGSLLRSVGLPELVTYSLDEYYKMALRLATDPQYLKELTLALEANRSKSSVFNTELFTRNVEKAYKTMWQIHVSNEQARPFAVNEDSRGE